MSLASEASFNHVASILGSPFPRFVAGIASVLTYHALAGVKHLIMDAGVGETMQGGVIGARIVFVLAAGRRRMGVLDMVTSVTSFSRTGLSDWLIQRVTSLVLLSYFIFIAYQLLGSVDYTSWRTLFDQTWMKVFTLMAALSLAAHAWIGLWSVFTDYLTERMLGPKGTPYASLPAGSLAFTCGVRDLDYRYRLELTAIGRRANRQT